MPDLTPQDTAAAYDAMAQPYADANEDNAYNALYERPATIALLPDVAERRVLDVGCGSGSLAAWLVAAGADVVGFDISAEMVALARGRELPTASFEVGDLGEPLDFLADASFDVVIASLVLHYLRDWVSPLRELRRVLRPHGSLVFSTHHPAMDIAYPRRATTSRPNCSSMSGSRAASRSSPLLAPATDRDVLGDRRGRLPRRLSHRATTA